MSKQSTFTAALATMLGATLGGLFLWRSLRAQKKKKTLSSATPTEPILAQRDAAVQPSQEPSAPPVSKNPLRAHTLLEELPVVISSPQDWDNLWPALQKDLSMYPVLGLDCEWVKRVRVSVKGRVSAVSLLQLSSFSGRCVLVRLLAFRDAPLPKSLVGLLRDPRVLKVGVGCYEDGKRLAQDHGLTLSCTVDLRYLALRRSKQAVLNNGLSLKSLAEDLLNVTLDKSVELRCSDWEAEELSPEQITYAARDAQISIALFFHLLGMKTERHLPAEGESVFLHLSACCQGLVDVPFRGRCGGDGEEGERRRRSRKSTVDSPESGDQQVPDPRRNKRKPLGVGYSARKSPLYDNCFLHAPDGQPLCTCDKKKAKWYLEKGIGELVSEDPFIVRLLFEPSGRPDSEKDYYLTAKENLCVVCGKVESYIRKNIVPHEYRRHFPSEMKDHNSHDILLLCTACHAASNVHDGALKAELAEEHAAPQGCEEGVRLLEDADRRRVRSAARALLSASDGMPTARKEELLSLIQSCFCNGQQVTQEVLQDAAALETRISNESYVPHGLKVVQAYAEQGLRGLMELECRWRQHFLTSMQPRHLPPLWCVNHNHDKYLRKYGEDLKILLN
ncbi:exonuclease 3'-5' domain-containing protein 2 isoform X1 [Danio aesculapii]|uniref:exonuclease 3'-5' domain-containing protein 2 isoform X1 n=1 Tax=Danio aesculapii TaxID=1142201 RepID=UPI0024C0DAC4|nr:exonuclease 3'-5' domain-containing protein 2 isoform X1 [Danio aesculapii]